MLEAYGIGCALAVILLARFDFLERKAKREDVFVIDIIGITLVFSWISVILLLILIWGTMYMEKDYGEK